MSAAPEARTGRPFFSICVPQYNRTSFLLKALESAAGQVFRDFEICISDDRSTDGRATEILRFLESSGIPFRYRVQKRNRRYDANLRAAIGLARGRYCILLGNDDAFASSQDLRELHALLNTFPGSGVVITNYREADGTSAYRRVPATAARPGGLDAALWAFHRLSFVSGLVLRTELAQGERTRRVDGSEMYQLFLATRLIARGASLVTFDRFVIDKGVRISGEAVDSYSAKDLENRRQLRERVIPLHRYAATAWQAVEPYCPQEEWSRTQRRILRRLFATSYPFWLVEYRRTHGWRYAAGIAAGMRPARVLKGIPARPGAQLVALGLYASASAAGLLVPAVLARVSIPFLRRLSKSA